MSTFARFDVLPCLQTIWWFPFKGLSCFSSGKKFTIFGYIYIFLYIYIYVFSFTYVYISLGKLQRPHLQRGLPRFFPQNCLKLGCWTTILVYTHLLYTYIYTCEYMIYIYTYMYYYFYYYYYYYDYYYHYYYLFSHVWETIKIKTWTSLYPNMVSHGFSINTCIRNDHSSYFPWPAS